MSARIIRLVLSAEYGTGVRFGWQSAQKAYEHIETRRIRPLFRYYPYVHIDGVYPKRSWDGEIQDVSILAAIGVSQDECREILGAVEGMKEDSESWRSFFVWLKERRLTGVRLIIGDKNLGMLETISEVFSDAKKIEDGIEETLTYMDFSTQHWTRIRTDNAIEQLNREIKRRIKTIGTFPDGQSALMFVWTRLRHVAATS